ncbi:MAG TPA: transporter substrate-binding domain-containing protein [bacterium]|nr:transporter substrate-binding domain-containing protein [bacterium]HPN30323.1 transporter substrate-binding domain-containing protein [bacterium]
MKTMKQKYCLFFFAVIIILHSNISLCFSRTLDEIKKSGILRVGFFKEKTSFAIDAEGNMSGFDFELAKSFAEYLNVKLIPVIVEWNQIFSKDESGKIIEKNKIYNPFIFESDSADIIAQEITKLKWREKLMNLVPVTKSRQALFGIKDGKQAVKISDLSNSKIYIRKNTSFHELYENKIKPKAANAEAFYSDEGNDEGITLLLSKSVDFSITDAFQFFGFKNENLKYMFSLSPSETLCWAIKKNNKELTNELKKFLTISKKSGVFDKIFKSYLGVSEKEYDYMLKK